MVSINNIINDFIQKDLKKNTVARTSDTDTYRITNLTEIFNITHSMLDKYLSGFIMNLDITRVYISKESHMENVLTLKGVHKLISHILDDDSHEKKIDLFVQKYFCYEKHHFAQFKNNKNLKSNDMKYVGNLDLVNNTYVKKLRNFIFPKDKILVNYNVPDTDHYIDIYFPEYNVAILMEENKGRKRSLAIRKDLPKRHILNKATWLYFTEYKNPHSFNKFLSFVGKITTAKKYE